MILRWFVDLEILEWTDRLKRTFFHQINTNISLGEGTKTKRITYEIEKGTTIAKRRTFTRKVRIIKNECKMTGCISFYGQNLTLNPEFFIFFWGIRTFPRTNLLEFKTILK